VKEVAFSLPISGIVRINGDSIEVVVNRAETTIQFEREEKRASRISLGRDRTIFDVTLEAAQSVPGDTIKRIKRNRVDNQGKRQELSHLSGTKTGGTPPTIAI